MSQSTAEGSSGAVGEEEGDVAEEGDVVDVVDVEGQLGTPPR
ncbi:hypothetical protein [Ornithinimicrobium sp. W1665]